MSEICHIRFAVVIYALILIGLGKSSPLPMRTNGNNSPSRALDGQTWNLIRSSILDYRLGRLFLFLRHSLADYSRCSSNGMLLVVERGCPTHANDVASTRSNVQVPNPAKRAQIGAVDASLCLTIATFSSLKGQKTHHILSGGFDVLLLTML